MSRRRSLLGLAGVVLVSVAGTLNAAQQPAPLATGQSASADFRRLAARLSAQRLDGAEGSEAEQEKALGILDAVALEALNAARDPDLNALNQKFAALANEQPPVGEDYHVVRLGGAPAVYALVANFGLGGPSAVRVYASASGRYTLSARIDRFAQEGFFDEYLEVVPVAAPVVLFVTVAGRTDDLQTGVFTAWRFDGVLLRTVWASDLLQQSSYEVRPEGFQLTYCAETDEENPRVCRKMWRGRYVWEGSTWKQIEQTPVAVPKE